LVGVWRPRLKEVIAEVIAERGVVDRVWGPCLITCTCWWAVQLPEAIWVPSGLNATLYTVPVCPRSGSPTGRPLAASHTRTVLSPLPETMRAPSGLNATDNTVPVWPVSGSPTGCPVAASLVVVHQASDLIGRDDVAQFNLGQPRVRVDCDSNNRRRLAQTASHKVHEGFRERLVGVLGQRHNPTMEVIGEIDRRLHHYIMNPMQ